MQTQAVDFSFGLLRCSLLAVQDTDVVARRCRYAPALARLRYMAACAVLLFSLGGSSAFAQAPQLEVKAADSCLRADALRSRVAHYMAHKATPVGVRVVVDLPSDGAELRIYRSDVLLSRRRFERLPTACEDRRDAVALTIALALEDPAVAAPAEQTQSAVVVSPNASPEATQVASTQITPEPEPETKPTPRSDNTTPPADDEPDQVVLSNMPSSISHSRTGERSLGLQFQLGARWLTEALAFPVWAGSLGVALPLSENIAVALSALASTLGTTSFEGGQARGRLYGLEAMGCGSLPLGPAALDLCAGATFAACDVSGRLYPMARPDTTLLWAAGLARVALRWPASSTFSLRLFAQGHVNLSRPTLQVERASRDLQPAWLGVSLGLELVISLP